MGHNLIELSTPGEVLKEEFLDPMDMIGVFCGLLLAGVGILL